MLISTPRSSESNKKSNESHHKLESFPQYASKLNLHALNPDANQNNNHKMRGYSEDIRQFERKRSLTHLPISVDDELRASPCEQGPSRSYFEGFSGIRSTRKDDDIDIV